MANDSGGGEDKRHGLWVVLSGLGTLLIVMGFSVIRYGDPKDAAAVITACSAVIGTLVGAFFGLNLGSAGRQEAEQKKDDANEALVATMGALSNDHPLAVAARDNLLRKLSPPHSENHPNSD